MGRADDELLAVMYGAATNAAILAMMYAAATHAAYI
jgi:hypothetical protein